jgi:hypothetical protein
MNRPSLSPFDIATPRAPLPITATYDPKRQSRSLSPEDSATSYPTSQSTTSYGEPDSSPDSQAD